MTAPRAPLLPLLLLAACVTTTSTTYGPPLLPAPPPVPVVRVADTAQSRVLPSGLRLVLDRDPSARVVVLASAVDAGAMGDPSGKGGLAHLVEHLTFRSVGQGGKTTLYQRLNRLPLTGSYFGATSWGQMRFRSAAPAGVWHELLAIEAWRLADPLAGIDERAVELERLITEDQAHMNDEAGEASSWSELLGDDVSAEESGIDDTSGSAESRRTLTLADARAFVTRTFRPEGMTLVVAGNVGEIDLDGLVALLPRVLVDAPAEGARRTTAAATPTRPIAVPSPAISFVPVAALERPVLTLTWRLPSLYSGDGPALRWMHKLISDVLDAGILRRIVSVDVNLQNAARGALLVVEVELLDARGPEAIVQVVENRVLAFTRAPEVGHRRFDLLRQQLASFLAQGGDSPTERALAVAALSNVYGQVVSPGRFDADMANTTWEQVASELWRCLSYPPHRAVRVPAPLPVDTTSAAGAGADAPGPNLLADAAKWDAASLRAFVDAPGLGTAHATKLPNGTTLLFLRRRGPGATAWLGYSGGLASAPTPALARWAQWHRPRFGEWATERELIPGGDTDEDTTFDTVSFRPANLAPALGLLVWRARSGVQDWPAPDDFQRTMAVEYADDNPSVYARHLFWRNLYPRHPYGRAYSSTDAWRVTQASAQKWVSDVVRPDNAALVVVGDLDEANVIATAKRAMEGWRAPAGRPPAPAPTPSLRETSTGPRTALVNQPGRHMMALHLGCLLPAADLDRAKRWVLTRAVSQRLENDLRHATGHSQGATVRLGEPRAAAHLAIAMAVDPSNLSAVLATIHRNWIRWGTKGFDAGETNAGKFSVVGLQAGLFESTHQLASTLFNEWVQARPLTQVDALPAQVLDVTAADLTSLFATCRDNAALVIRGDRALLDPAMRAIWPGTEPAL